MFLTLLIQQPALSERYDEDGFLIEEDESSEVMMNDSGEMSDDSNSDSGFDEMGCDPDFNADCRPGRESIDKLPNLEINPLNPAGDSLDILLKRRLNDGLWEIILGNLSCADLSPDCVSELQNAAVSNSLALQEIDLRIEEAQIRIDEAQANNKKSIRFEVLSPALQYYLGSEPSSFDESRTENFTIEVPTTEVVQVPTIVEVPFVETVPIEVIDPETGEVTVEQQQRISIRQQVENRPELRQTTRTEQRTRIINERPRGGLDRIFADLSNPVQLANNLLQLVGIPFLENVLGGSQQSQQRAIAIGDLQIKVAELQRSRAEIAQALREEVVEVLLVVDAASKEFQISQEIGLRDSNRLAISRINYQFGEGTSEEYLAQISSFDRQKAQVLRTFNQMRSSLEKLRVLVSEPEF